MRIILIIGVLWVGVCMFILWLNHRFPRRRFPIDDRQDIASRTSVRTQHTKTVIQLTGEDGVKVVSTNISVSPKTGEITSPGGEVELESYRKPGTEGIIRETPPDEDIEQ